MRPLCSASSGSIASSRRRLDRGQRAGLVLLDQARVADDVGGQDRRQPALDARRGCRGLRRHHLGSEQVAVPRHGLEHLLRLVAQRLADVAHALGDQFVTDHHVGPDRGHDRVAVHHPAGVLDQQPQQRERFRPQRHLGAVGSEQSTAAKVEGEAVEAPGPWRHPFGIHRPVLPGLAAADLPRPRI